MKSLLLTICCLIGCRLTAADYGPQCVVAWGRNLSTQDTNLPPKDYFFAGNIHSNVEFNRQLVAISGWNYAVAIQRDSRIVPLGTRTRQFVTSASNCSLSQNGTIVFSGQVLTNVTALSVGKSSDQSYVLALLADGQVIAWGENRYGQTTVPKRLTNAVAISAGSYHCLALRPDGTVATWGVGSPIPKGLTNVIAISAGNEGGRNLALKADGTVVDWQVRSSDSSSSVPCGLSNVVAISSGAGHFLALRKDGTVWGWGENIRGEATGVPTPLFPHEANGIVTFHGQVLSNIVAIAAGGGFSLALNRSGEVVLWGQPYAMKLSVPSGLSGVTAIAAGQDFCLAVTTNSAFCSAMQPK